jgi:uncharacterized protein YecE (DUF72 family)
VTPLFESAPAFDRDHLQQRLRELSARNIRIGGSSWKYEGWLDQIYTRDRYSTRGRLSRKHFEQHSLEEYVTVFPTVCGDFAFYQFPAIEYWARLFRVTPPSFRWGLKVPEQITVAEWPMHMRYGDLAGQLNPSFLDMHLFEQSFLAPLSQWRQLVGVLIFEFGALQGRQFGGVREFARVIDIFFSKLPRGWRCAIEVRNPQLLAPVWFDTLRAHEIAHVYNAWTGMPDLSEQISMPGSRTTDMIVARAINRRGRSYEEAERMFLPFDRLVEINEPARQGLRRLIDIAAVDEQPAYLFVNNSLEGNTPGTILAIVD